MYSLLTGLDKLPDPEYLAGYNIEVQVASFRSVLDELEG